MAKYYQVTNPNGSVSTYSEKTAQLIKSRDPNVKFSNTFTADSGGSPTSGSILGSGGSKQQQVYQQPQGHQYQPVQDNLDYTYETRLRAAEQSASQADAEMRQYLEQQREAERAAIQAQIEQGKNRLQGSKANVDRAYEDTARQNYILSEKNKAAMPQQLSALGISGGLAQQGVLQSDLDYQNRQHQGRIARDTSLQQIEQDINNLRSSGDMQMAQSAADYSARLAELMQKAQQRELDMSMWATQNAVQQQNWQKDYDARQQQVAEEQAMKQANIARDTARALGYENPYSQYALTPDIMNRLEPYQGDYAQFILDNPNSQLTGYARNARFQKMLSMGSQFADELEQYRSPDYYANQLDNQYRQAQIDSTKALANQRNTPVAPKEPSQSQINASIRTAIEQDLASISPQQAYEELLNYPQDYIRDLGVSTYNQLLNGYANIANR